MSKPYQIYQHLVKGDVFGVATKIKEQRKSNNNDRNRRRRTSK